MKLKLIDDWRDAWRWLSVNCMVLAAALQGAWATIPEYLRDQVPTWSVADSTVALLVLGVVGRVVQQPVKIRKKPPAKKPAPKAAPSKRKR